MRLKIGIWLAIAVAVFTALLAVVPAVLKSAHVDWPAWSIALAGATVTALVGLGKPVADVVAQWLASRTKRDLDRQALTREIEHATGGRSKGLPLAHEITDRALLGIHPSIPLPPNAEASLEPDLPLYIPRDIDADLRTWMTAHRETGGFLLLVGPAASGKSRCAYELVQATLAEWPIFMPSSSVQLTDYFEADPTLEKLVIWLNETQKFLGVNGLTAATIHRIFACPWPTIIIGTIWPQHYDTLTSQPGIALDDSNRDSREILTIFAHRQDLLPGFSSAELDRAESLAAHDPRIAEAVGETGSRNLPETLAAAPDLISRWLNAADSYGAAVITAAVIARRCGHPEPLPASVLEPLAGAMLTPADRSHAASGWFQAAIDWARSPVRGSAAPLTPQAAIPGIIDGDRPSDVLVQYAARHQTAPGHIIGEAIWLLLIERATPEASRHIADVAYRQRRAHQAPIAERAIRKAADHGDVAAMFNLGVLLREQGRDDEAETCWREAAAAEHVAAMFSLGVMLKDRDEPDEAEGWYRKAAIAGHAAAMFNLGLLLAEHGKDDEAENWYREAAAAGDADAMVNLGLLLVGLGQVDEAEIWYRKAVEAGDSHAVVSLGLLLRRQGRDDEAETCWREAAAAGDTDAMVNLGLLLRVRGRDDEAETWYRKAAAAGHADAMFNLGIMLEDRGRDDEAETWWREAAAAGDTDAMASLRLLLRRQGRDDEAEPNHD